MYGKHALDLNLMFLICMILNIVYILHQNISIIIEPIVKIVNLTMDCELKRQRIVLNGTCHALSEASNSDIIILGDFYQFHEIHSQDCRNHYVLSCPVDIVFSS